MGFSRYDIDGNRIRKSVVVDCSEDKILVEQSHKSEVDINNIVRRHGMDLIAKTAAMQTPEYRFDDVPGNDFTEAMLIITKAQQNFEQLPSDIRKEFHNSAAEYVDYIQNPDNNDALIERGWVNAPVVTAPVEVIVTNPETPPPE